MIEYKFREDELIEEFKNYIDQTYNGHYGQGGLQSSEVIVDRGHGLGFFLGNVDKYNGRYGKKGTPADHRKDILKIIHYGFLALYEHDRLNAEKTITISDMDCSLGLTDNVVTIGGVDHPVSLTLTTVDAITMDGSDVEEEQLTLDLTSEDDKLLF